MAEQGALERVDIGRGHLIKMTPSDAAAWRAAHQPVVPVIEAMAALSDAGIQFPYAEPEAEPEPAPKAPARGHR